MKAKIAQLPVKTIKQAFLTALKNDRDVKMKLAAVNKCTVFTVERWLRNGDQFLTTATNLDIIRNHFGLLEGTEILEIESVGVQ